MRPMVALLVGAVFVWMQPAGAADEGAARPSDCSDLNFFSDGTKQDTINKIMEWSSCIKRTQKQRVGKYFCYISDMVGIQKNEDGSTFAGEIKPKNEKFFLTISEVPDFSKEYACKWEYGLLTPHSAGNNYSGQFAQNFGNQCLSNFDWKFSNEVEFLCPASNDTHGCAGGLGGVGSFNLYSDNSFRMFKSSSNSYVLRGKCEKIN